MTAFFRLHNAPRYRFISQAQPHVIVMSWSGTSTFAQKEGVAQRDRDVIRYG
jgi:hypothetical protein